MRDSRPQPLDNLFDDSNHLLRNVQQRAIVLLKLNNTVKSLLPTELQTQCRVANYRNGILVLETPNANWLMRLRYEQPKLLSTLRADILPSLASIDIKINPSFSTKLNQVADQTNRLTVVDQQPLRQLSLESAQHIIDLANRSPERLRKKLERLALLAGESANQASRKK